MNSNEPTEKTQDMKRYLNYMILLVTAVMIAGLIGVSTTSCQKETPGDPEIFYVRVTDPDKADSLMIGAYMGNLVAIVGQNLNDVKEIWFNDQEANLNPAYITSTTILVSVPSTVPSVVTDKMKLVFGDGSELLYDFKVNVPGPQIAGVKCEFVPAGETMELTGDYFFDPKVTFTGGVQGTVADFDKLIMHVVVPEGAEPGPVTIQTNFGKVKSKFMFRDNSNTILDFDVSKHESWTAPIADPASNPSPAPCDGGYAFFKHAAVGEWMWTNELTMQLWGPRSPRGQVPLARGLVSDLVFKFDVNVPIEWKDVRMEIFFGPYAEDHGRDKPNSAIARWKPWKNGPYKTNGWETISIPLTEFRFGPNDGTTDEIGTRSITNLPELTNITMMIFGPSETGAPKSPIHICFDNVRIVSK
jgi:hypothetical protein